MQFDDEIGQKGTIVGAPVFVSRMAPLTPRPKAAVFFDAVLAVAESAHRQQLPVDANVICRLNANFDPDQVRDLLGTSKFQRALEDRGIPVTTVDGLTSEQLTFLRIFMDPTLKADNAKRLRIAGATQAQLEGWLQQDPFRKRFTEISHDLLQSSMPVARQRLAMGVDAGRLDFIKFAMELTGEYDPRGGPTVDVMAFGRLMLDVITQEAAAAGLADHGQALVNRIGARMTLVMQGQPNDLPELEAAVVETEERSA